MKFLIALINRYQQYEGFIFPPLKIKQPSAHAMRQLSSLIMLMALFNSLLSPLAQARTNEQMNEFANEQLATSPSRNLAHSPSPYYPAQVAQAKPSHVPSEILKNIAYATPTLPQPAPIEDIFTYTDIQGYYSFPNLEKGTHKITLDLTTLPPTMPLLADEASPILWLNPNQRLTAPALSNQVSFTAFYDAATATISGHVFVDKNGNGQPDVDEPGVPNVKVIDPTVHVYFVPFNDIQLSALFQNKAGSSCYGSVAVGGLSTTIESFIYMTAASDDTIYYYDHWEDGYDTDPLNPLPSSTTEIGALDAGTTKVFQDTIDPANINGINFHYDGQDRITLIGTGATVIRQAYPQSGIDITSATFSGVIAAAAWEIPEVANWGSNFIATIGQDLNTNGILSPNDHDRTALSITAVQAGTIVSYNGSAVATLNVGETYSRTNVVSTDTIATSAPVQVHLLSGGCDTSNGYGVSSNGYDLEPRDNWTNAYWVPVPGFANDGSTCTAMGASDPDTDIYLHNPNDTDINVTLSTTSTIIPILAHTTVSLLDVLGTDISTNTQGIFLKSQDGSDFWGVGIIDSTTRQVSTEGIDYDWGYSLVPLDNLSSQVVLGYAPGNGAPFPTDNGNLAFVVPTVNTIIKIDLDQDDTPDKMDLNGDGDILDNDVFGNTAWDETTSNLGIPVDAGQILRIGSYASRNLQGAIIYTDDVEKKIAVAWGQDPCRAGDGSPYLDLGNTVVPNSMPILTKRDTLVIDTDGSGTVTPNDVVSYTLELFNNSIAGDLNDAVITDSLPFTYSSFISGSITNSSNGLVSTPMTVTYSTDGINFSSDPATNAQKLRFQWASIGAEALVTVSFKVQINSTIPETVTEITNLAQVSANTIKTTNSQDPDDPTDPDTDTPIGRPKLTMTKQASLATIRPGEIFTYTILITNSGNGPANNLVLSDTLPFGLNYISNSVNITYPKATVISKPVPITKTTALSIGFYADDFDNITETATSGYTGNDGTLTNLWVTGWQEIGEVTNAGAGSVQVISPTIPNAKQRFSPPGALSIQAPSLGVTRQANLTTLTNAPVLQFYARGIGTNNDGYLVSVSSPSTSLSFPQSIITSTDYSLVSVNLSAFRITSPVIISITTNSGLTGRYFFDDIILYESKPYKTDIITITTYNTVVTYTNQTNQDPVSYTNSSGALVITNTASLPANTAMTITFRVSASIPLTNSAWLTNNAVVSTTALTYTISATAPVQILSSHALTLTKTATPDPIATGGFITYTLRYTVSGNDPAPNLTISDTVPTSTTFSSASAGYGHNNGLITWALGNHLTAASGITFQSGTVTVAVQLDAAYTGTTVVNTARLTDSTPLSSTATVTVTVSNSPTLVIAKSSVDVNGAPLMPGDILSYTLVVTNIGGTDASNVTISDTLPMSTSYITNSITGGDTRNNSSPFSWTINSLVVNTPMTLTFGVTVNNGVTTGTNLINTAVVTASNYPTPTTAMVTNTVVTPQLGLLLLTNNVMTVTPGSVVTYFHTLINIGNITDVYTLTVISGTGTSSVITVTLGPNQAISLTTVVTVPLTATVGLYDTTVLSATSQTDPTITAATTDKTNVTELLPILTLTKSSIDVNGAPLFAGDVLSYSLVVRNVGAITATNVTISDTLPANTSYIANSIGCNGCHIFNLTSPFSWTIYNLAVNTPVTLTFAVTINNGVLTGTNIINTAVVTASNYLTPTTAMVTNTVVTPSYGLQLLTDNNSTVSPGGVASYPHTLINTGNVTDTYTITVLSGFGVRTLITVTLGPGQSVPFNMIVTVPAGTPAGPFDTTRIQAVSWANSNVSVIRTDVTTVILAPTPVTPTPTPTQTPTPNFALNPNNESTVPRGETVNYTHTLTNTGQITDTYVLTISSNSGFSVTLSTITITLAPGQSFPLTVSVTVPLTAPIGSVDTTIITATSTVSPNLTHSVTDITRVPDPELTLVKENTSTAIPGQIVTYTHYISNTGNATDTYVITVTSQNGWTVTTSLLTVTLGPGQGLPLILTTVVPITAPLGSTDVATITATSTLNPNESKQVTDITRIPLPGFDLDINNQSMGNPGQVISYPHVITNTGQVTDIYTITVVSNNGWQVTSSIVTITLGPGQSMPFYITVTVPITATPGMTDITTISASPFSNPSLVDTVRDVTTTPISGVEIDPPHTSTTEPGKTVTYTHVVTNHSSVTDTFTVTVMSNNGFTVTSSIITITLGPGQSAPLTVTVTIPPTITVTTVDTMTVTITSITTPTVTDTVTNTTIVNPGVVINPPHTSTTEPGKTVTYSHVMTNYGSVTDTFTVTVVSSNGFTVTSSIITITLGPGQSAPLIVTVTIPPTATISTVDTMTVTVTSTTNPNVTDTVTNTTLVILPDVQTTKADILLIDADGDKQPSPGDTLRYEIKITNHGNGTARGVILTDLLSDPNLTLVPNSVTTTQGIVLSATDTVLIAVGDIEPQQTVMVSFAAQIVKPLPANVTMVANQSIVSGENFPTQPSDDPNTPTPDDPTITPLTPLPLIKAYKAAIVSQQPVKPGDTIRYVITITNYGNAAATFTLLNDQLDPNTTLVVGSVETSQGQITSGNNEGDVHVSVNVGEIPPFTSPLNQGGQRGVVTIQFLATINNPLPPSVTHVANQAIIAGENFPSVPTDNPNDPPVDNETVTPVTQEPLINVYKTHSLLLDADNSGFASPGDTLVYQIQVVNSGNTTGTLTFLKDTLDAHTSLVVGTVQTTQGIVIQGNNAGDTQVQVNLGDIAPNGVINLSFAVTVNNPLPANVTHVANQAVVSGSNIPSTPSDNPQEPPSDDETETPLQTEPLIHAYKRDSLWLDTNGNGVASAGDSLMYHITIVNRGNGAANNVIFTDIITDPYLSLITGTVQSDLGIITEGNGANDHNVSLTIGTLPVGAEVRVSFQVRIADPLPLTVTQVANQGLVTGSNIPPIPTEDPDELCPVLRRTCHNETETPIFQPAIDLSKVLESSSPTYVTERITYTIRITNTGNTTLVTIPLTDVYDFDYLTFIEAKPAPDRLNATRGQITWHDLTNSLGDLAPGASFSVQVIMKARRATPNDDPASNLAVVKKAIDEHGEQPPDTGKPSEVEVIILPNISLSKLLDTPQPIFVGDEVTFTIRITNQGRTTIVTLPLVDNYEAKNLQYLRATPSHDQAASGIITWTDLTQTLGDLPPAASVTVQVAFRVLTATTSTINSATASNALDELGQSVSANDRAFLAVSTLTSLELVKSDQGLIARPGQFITYTLNYTNPSTQMATGVTLQEIVPANTTFNVSQSNAGWTCRPNNDAGSGCSLLVGNLAAGQGGAVLFVVKVNDTPLAQIITNTAIITAETHVTQTQTITTPVIIGQPLLSFSKQVTPTQVVSPGDRLVYTLCYSNPGSEMARQVVITDIVPTNTTYISNSVTKLQGSVEFYDNGTWTTQEPATVSQIRWLIGNLPADGQTRCVSFAVTVNEVFVVADTSGQSQQLQYTEQGWRVLPRMIYLPLLLNGRIGEVETRHALSLQNAPSPSRIIPFASVNVTIPNTALIGAQNLPPQQDTVTNTVVRLIDPIITKEANVTQARVGDIVDYFITILNPAPPGNTAALGLVISDVMPLQLDLVSYEVSRPDLLNQVKVITNIVPVVGHPLGINQAIATTVTLTIPVLAENESVSLHVRARVNNLANPAPQIIRNIAILGVPGRTDQPTVEVVVNIPAPTPQPKATPKPDKDDDDDVVTPPAYSPPPTSAASNFASPTAQPKLPVILLPETGAWQTQIPMNIAWLISLMAMSLAVYLWRRK